MSIKKFEGFTEMDELRRGLLKASIELKRDSLLLSVLDKQNKDQEYFRMAGVDYLPDPKEREIQLQKRIEINKELLLIHNHLLPKEI